MAKNRALREEKEKEKEKEKEEHRHIELPQQHELRKRRSSTIVREVNPKSIPDTPTT